MDWAEAEAFRKAVAKARDEEDLEPLRERFLRSLEGTLGLVGERAEEVWRMVEGFRGYGFTESHAQAFARHAYASLWLKHRYPAEFLAGVLSEMPGMWPPATWRQEARRLGVPFLPLSINRSGLRYRVEGVGGKKALRPPLTAAKGVSEEAARAILRERLRGPFTSLEDFRARLHPPVVLPESAKLSCGQTDLRKQVALPEGQTDCVSKLLCPKGKQICVSKRTSSWPWPRREPLTSSTPGGRPSSGQACPPGGPFWRRSFPRR
ncbi:hypothetical protein CSW22_06965, partial [Thermus scotoductus]